MDRLLETGTVLDRIVAKKKEEVARLKSIGPAPAPAVRAPHLRRGFIDALRDKSRHGRAVIAEIKKASPSAGVLREPFNPEAIAGIYAKNGARCISVITDQEFFQGSIEVLRRVREVSDLPILRKDFIIDNVQIEETANEGADAMLLIVRILSDSLLSELLEHALAHQLAVLVEVHDQNDMERALKLTPRPELIGINNRDLSDFTVSVERTIELLPMMPEGVTVVSESGLDGPQVLDRLMEAGVDAFLIGTALMKAGDMGKELDRLVFG